MALSAVAGCARRARLAPTADAAGPGADTGAVQRVQRQYAEAILGGGLVRLIGTASAAEADAAAAPRWLTRTALADPSVASDGHELARRLEAVQTAEDEVARLYARWEELAAKIA